ncbi:MAG: histone-like nucleoid-structuring protein Lsr2 [Streptosporangiaceae bacterium]
MAQKVQVVLLCDMDHDEPVAGSETVTFGFGGKEYELDLCRNDAAKLRRRMNKYVDHARKAGRTRGRRTRARSSRARSSEIREWARSQGIKVSERGRIPSEVIQKYEGAHR